MFYTSHQGYPKLLRKIKCNRLVIFQKICSGFVLLKSLEYILKIKSTYSARPG